MANFLTTYKKVIEPLERGYVNLPNDKGGETYKGIARNFQPQWDGWVSIDFEKRTRYKGGIPRFTEFPNIDYLVVDFYDKKWKRNRMSEINNQNIANLLFDYMIHSGTGTAVKAIQNILGVKVDGIIGPITLGAINSTNPNKLFSKLLEQREKFLDRLIMSDPTQEIFRKGWSNRLEFFATFQRPHTGHIIITSIVILTLIFILS